LIGAGKTTLFRMITGQEARCGEMKVGETVRIGIVDQSRDALNADKTGGRRSPAGTTSCR
jgi:ATPase subunit of ABC transporter with duplicated ATPase domains